MGKTVLITGSSSGIGKACVEEFQKNGWQVAATMRRPDQDQTLKQLTGVALFPLDVTVPASIDQAVTAAESRFGPIDVLVNNAGYGLVGPFEASTPEQIGRQFQTNVFGLMNVTRAIIPRMRERRDGTIINIASIGGRLTFPFYSLYHGTKWAVEGFSESLRFELDPFNVRIKIIEPGPIKTDFYDRSLDVMKKPGLTAYDALLAKAMANMQKSGENGAPPEATAKVVYRAASDGSSRLRYQSNDMGLLTLRRLLPDGLFLRLIKTILLK